MKINKLFAAVERGSVEAVRKALLKRDVNSRNDDGDTPLHLAAPAANLDLVRCLLDAGASVDLENSRGETVLQCVLYDRHKSCDSRRDLDLCAIMETLINHGADVRSRGTKDGFTALHLAARFENVDFIKYLLARGAEVDARDDIGRTPLHLAAFSFLYVTAPVEALLAAHAEVNAACYLGDTPLHYALISRRLGKQSRQILKIIDVFLRHKADFNVRNRLEMTPMDYLNAYNHSCELYPDLVKAFIQRGGVDVNNVHTPFREESRVGQTNLHIACSKMNLDLVNFLLKNGADVNALDTNSVSPLQQVLSTCASKDFDIIIVECLLRRNPDVNVITSEGAHVLSAKEDMPECLWKMLVEYLAKLDASGVELHATILESIEGDADVKSYFEECKQELQSLKDHGLSTSRITLFNLLVEAKGRLVKFAQNQELVKDFNEIAFAEKYPIYGEVILERFSEAIEHQQVLKRAALVLSSCLPVYLDPTHIVIVKILSYCDMNDLKELCS